MKTELNLITITEGKVEVICNVEKDIPITGITEEYIKTLSEEHGNKAFYVVKMSNDLVIHALYRMEYDNTLITKHYSIINKELPEELEEANYNLIEGMNIQDISDFMDIHNNIYNILGKVYDAMYHRNEWLTDLHYEKSELEGEIIENKRKSKLIESMIYLEKCGIDTRDMWNGLQNKETQYEAMREITDKYIVENRNREVGNRIIVDVKHPLDDLFA